MSPEFNEWTRPRGAVQPQCPGNRHCFPICEAIKLENPSLYGALKAQKSTGCFYDYLFYICQMFNWQGIGKELGFFWKAFSSTLQMQMFGYI